MKYGILLLAFLMTACAQDRIVDKPILVDREELVLPEVQPVTQAPVIWEVIIKDGKPIFAMTPESYQNLSVNVGDLRRYIIQQNAVIDAYRSYLKKEEERKNNKLLGIF